MDHISHVVILGVGHFLCGDFGSHGAPLTGIATILCQLGLDAVAVVADAGSALQLGELLGSPEDGTAGSSIVDDAVADLEDGGHADHFLEQQVLTGAGEHGAVLVDLLVGRNLRSQVHGDIVPGQGLLSGGQLSVDQVSLSSAVEVNLRSGDVIQQSHAQILGRGTGGCLIQHIVGVGCGAVQLCVTVDVRAVGQLHIADVVGFFVEVTSEDAVGGTAVVAGLLVGLQTHIGVLCVEGNLAQSLEFLHRPDQQAGVLGQVNALDTR